VLLPRNSIVVVVLKTCVSQPHAREKTAKDMANIDHRLKAQASGNVDFKAEFERMFVAIEKTAGSVQHNAAAELDSYKSENATALQEQEARLIERMTTMDHRHVEQM
jgi:hypothetical protein